MSILQVSGPYQWGGAANRFCNLPVAHHVTFGRELTRRWLDSRTSPMRLAYRAYSVLAMISSA